LAQGQMINNSKE